MKNFLTSYSVLIISVVLNAPTYVFGNDLCDTSHLFTPKWNAASKTCMLRMDIAFPDIKSDKQYDIFFDFGKKNIFVGKKQKLQNNSGGVASPEYSFFHRFNFITFKQPDPPSKINLKKSSSEPKKIPDETSNYTYQLINGAYFERPNGTDYRHDYLNIFPAGLTSQTNTLPLSSKNDMVSISEESNTCSNQTKKYFAVKVNGKTQHLIDPDYKYSSDLSQITEEKKCNSMSESQTPETTSTPSETPKNPPR